MTNPPLPPDFTPRTLFLEPTSHCNMHCAFCPSDVLRRPKGHLPDETARRFLGELHALGVKAPILLNVLGEPLLNQRVFGYLDLLEEAGQPVTLITNLTLLGGRSVRAELLGHSNLTLALSLQTATRRSYRLRGYPKLPFRKFFALAEEVIEDKFRLGSGARLEVHIASNYVLAHDPTVQADGRLDLWRNFRSEAAERRFVGRTLRRLDRLAGAMEKKYGPAFAAERDRAAAVYKDHLGTRIAADRAALPADFHRLKDDVFWGYMALPNVFLVFKSLELWTRDPAFLKAALPPDRFVYLEERDEPRTCLMADSFGLLANGDFVLCCLDYEGEMKIGNIAEMTVERALASAKRASVRADAMSEAVCRRCKGTLFVFETKPLAGAEQAVDKFGRGWWDFEPTLHGLGGRWTKGLAWAYVFARIPGRRVRLSYFSPHEDGAALELRLSAGDPGGDGFSPAAVFALPSVRGVPQEFEAAFDFTPGRLYRVEVASPTFVPDESLGNGDLRTLGLAVSSLALRR